MSLVLQKQIRTALEIFDAVLGPARVLLVQLSLQAAITQLRPLHTLNRLFYSVYVNNSAMPFTNYEGSEINDKWRMAEVLNSCVETSSVTKKKGQRKGVVFVRCLRKTQV